MRSTRHSRYNINYHLVWIPKYRKPVLTAKVATDLKEILENIADSKGLEILGLEIMPDHIHLVVSSPPQHAPSLLVNWFKGISARIYNHRWGTPYIRWTNSYYVGTAGTVTSETIKRYIEEQKSK
jgi:putative transposase